MNDIVVMNTIDSSQDLIENINTFLPVENLITEFILKIVKISHITIFHDQKVPITL